MATVRTFVGIATNSAVRERALELRERLRRSGAQAKWTASENLHLTLKFLGDVPEEQVPRVCYTVAEAASVCKPFQLHFRGAGAFPNTRRPRTVWIGVAEGEAELRRLQKLVDWALRKLRFPREPRRYHPHLTIGRIRGAEFGSSNLKELLQESSQFDAATTFIDEVIVFASSLGSEGSTYTVLARAALADPQADEQFRRAASSVKSAGAVCERGVADPLGKPHRVAPAFHPGVS